MFRIIRYIVFFFLFQHSFSLHGQISRDKWSNKDKGTYTISFSYMPVVPKDNPKNAGLSIKMFELTSEGCKRIEGWARINGSNYFIYDSTEFIDQEGEKDLTNFFFTQIASGVCEIRADAGKDYYIIKTNKYILLPSTAYTFYFYFVRKDVLKRN